MIVSPSGLDTKVEELRTWIVQTFQGRVYLDVESLWCYFCVGFRFKDNDNVVVLEINPLTSQNDAGKIAAVMDYLAENSLEIVTFNGNDYDLPLLNYIVQNTWLAYMPADAACEAIKRISNMLIDVETRINVPMLDKLEARNYRSLDYYRYWSKLLRLTKNISLKAIGIQLGYPVVQELPIHHDTRTITPEQIAELKYYNSVHDLMILVYMDTRKFNWQGAPTNFQEMVDLRYAAIEQYGFDKRVLAWDAVKLGLAVLLHDFPIDKTKKGRTTVKLGDIISSVVKFNSPVLTAILEDLKNTTVSSTTEISKEIHIHGTIYDLKSGGLHNHCIAGHIQPVDDEVYLDWDVGSFYPALMAELDCSPVQAPNLNLKFRKLRADRMELKHIGKGKSPEANLIKLSLNGSIGSINQTESEIYDPAAFLKVTLNGQLYLLMLCEMLYEAGVVIDMVNTDGVSFIAKKSILPRIREIWDEWQRLTLMELEEVEFKCAYRLFGNSYLAIPKQGKPKQKGSEFITNPDLGNSCDFLIVPKAVNAYLIDGIDPEEFIKQPNHHIFDFCASQKVGKQFTVYYNNQKVQRLNRYYISKSGSSIYKMKGRTRSALTGLKGVSVQLYNNHDESLQHDIDYDFYLELIYKTLDVLEPKQKKQLSLW